LDDDYPLADFEVFAPQRPHDDFSHVDGEGMGYRDIDRDYDWSEHFG
jgi:hypothetical protein